MNKTFWAQWLESFSDNVKSKACPFDILRAGCEPRRRIENRKLVGFSLIAFVLMVAVAQAQQPKKVFRIGYLSSFDPASESARSEGIRLALRELGYIEGQNIATEVLAKADRVIR